MIKKISGDFESVFLKTTKNDNEFLLKEDEKAFQEAMRKVKPMSENTKFFYLKQSIINLNFYNIYNNIKEEYNPNLRVGYLTKKLKKDLKNNKKKIEKVLDLHGYTVAETEILLIEFLQECVLKKVKVALIITGKGKNSDVSQNKQGAIKSFFLLWITSNVASNYIASYSTASHNHGGEGAFYILLRNKS